MAAGAHWAKKRVEGRKRVREVAFELFERKGFEATTVDEIAEVSGVSRRSIFRYFKSKEGIFFATQHEKLEMFRALVNDPQQGETPYQTARRACLSLAQHFEQDRSQIMAHYRITATAQTLMPLDASLNRSWDDAMLSALLRGEESTWHHELLAGAMMGLVRSVLRGWVSRGALEDLHQLGELAFTSLEEGFGLTP
jgi:AcrR family transcriptional regulator